ncbi:MAG: rod shape-determining protein MreD [Actinobacteria bacterium]|nr:rod shape-determining protein MreD [Actinomycetota bacterium]
MTVRRAVAALAAVVSAMIVQAGLVVPLAGHIPVSLPAILVAAVALATGPSTGIALGFTAGLLADLASQHPAGVLALCWLGLGVGAGLLAEHTTKRRAIIAGALAALSTFAAGLLLAALGPYGTPAMDCIRYAGPAAIGDVAVALALTPIVQAMLRSPALRARPAVRRA